MKEKSSILSFESASKWEEWLSKNYNKSEGIRLRIYKKGSEKISVTYVDALYEALCYGWIDGQKDKYDDESWLQKFTPRRPGSIWSKNNTKHVERLIKAGKMKPEGFKEVEKAKLDGRWEKAYESARTIAMPEDFLTKLNKNQKAKAFFDTLNKANTYAIAWRLHNAKKPETRKKRMKTFIEMLAKGEKLHP